MDKNVKVNHKRAEDDCNIRICKFVDTDVIAESKLIYANYIIITGVNIEPVTFNPFLNDGMK